MDSVKASDELAGAGATGPRITLEGDILPAIATENTINLGAALTALGQPAPESTQLVTLHVVTLKNGFTVVGKSAPISAENFDAEKGKTFAREDAIREIWPLMAYSALDRRAAGQSTGDPVREPA